MIARLDSIILGALLAAMPVAPAATTTLKLLTFNILTAGNAVNEIGSTSPLYQQPRHADIAAVIIQSGADIVGVLEPNSASPDPILTALQANNPAWQKRGNLYAKFPIEADPHNAGDTSTHLVRTGPEQFVICHVAHWTPSNGYGPDIIQNRIIAGTVPGDPDQFDAEIVADVTQPATYQATLNKVKPHIQAGRPVFVFGDFNEPSHLDWTAAFAANGMDAWVANPTSTPLRFKITWPGSKLLIDGGLKDSFRTVFPDPVAKPGTTWTPPYANGTPGRRPYDGNTTTTGSPNQILVRIDWLLFAGNGVTATAAAVVGENPANPEHQNKSAIQPDIQYTGSWPSDHRAVLGTFTLPAVTGPLIPNPIPESLPTRASAHFTGTINPIEGDADPVSLATWDAHPTYGAPPTTINGNGTLTITLPNNSYPVWQLPAGDFVPPKTTGWTWETRFRIDSANDPARGVWEIFLRDNASGLAATRLHFLSTGLDRDTAGFGVTAEVAADLTNDFHVVRAAVKPGTNATTVWLDGVKVINSLTSADYNAAEFGVIGRWGGQTRGGTTTIDYIRFDTTGAYAPSGTASSDVPPSPANGSTISRTQPLYWWPVGNATGYRVWFGTSASFAAADDQGPVSTNYFNPGKLLENTTYHWRVDTETSAGTVPGALWSFTTGSGGDLTPKQSYQGWKLMRFPTAVVLDATKEPTHWGDLADLDGDGIRTMLECALGGDPAVPDPQRLPQAASDAGFPVFRFRQRIGASGTPGLGSSAWGLVYQVEAGPNLTTWHSGPSWIEHIGTPVDNGDGTETATVRLLNPDPDGWFARLAVTAAP